MLPNHSISQTSAGSKGEARGGAGVHSAHAAGRAASLPHQMTGPDLAAQQV